MKEGKASWARAKTRHRITRPPPSGIQICFRKACRGFRASTASELFGRGRELGLIEAFIAGTAVGGGALILFGEPGVGKTVNLSHLTISWATASRAAEGDARDQANSARYWWRNSATGRGGRPVIWPKVLVV